MSSDGPSNPTPRRADIIAWSILGLVALAVLGYVTFVKPRTHHDVGTAHPSVGQAFGDFEALPLLNAERQIASAELQGHVSLISYWGPWCPPCLLEMPHLLKLAENLRNEPRFLFVPIACPYELDQDLDQFRQETAAILERFKAKPATYTLSKSMLIALSSPAIDESLRMSYPTTVLVDTEGKIRGKWIGFDSRYPAEISDVIEALLKQMR